MSRRRSLWLGVLSAVTLVVAVFLFTAKGNGSFVLAVRAALVGCLTVATYSFFAHAVFNTTRSDEEGGS